MQNTSPDSSPKVLPAASTSSRGSDGPFDGGSPSQATLPQTLDMLVFEPDVDLVDPVSLDSGTSTPPPLAGPSSPKMPMPDVNNASGSKRKQVDDERATSEAEERPHDRKKLKEMHLNDGAPSPIIPGHMSDVAGAENLELGRPRSPSLEDELSRLTSDSFESPSPFPETTFRPSNVPHSRQFDHWSTSFATSVESPTRP
ncbi:hypothetical protein BC826DRAFT_1102185 [Russula brevipes]|nr:hypothetical protein BC826DRAFT_1102185 [Russula brevipes]